MRCKIFWRLHVYAAMPRDCLGVVVYSGRLAQPVLSGLMYDGMHVYCALCVCFVLIQTNCWHFVAHRCACHRVAHKHHSESPPCPLSHILILIMQYIIDGTHCVSAICVHTMAHGRSTKRLWREDARLHSETRQRRQRHDSARECEWFAYSMLSYGT